MAGGAYSGHDEAFLATHPTLMKPFRLGELEQMIGSLDSGRARGQERTSVPPA